jgi:hypothetical protein
VIASLSNIESVHVCGSSRESVWPSRVATLSRSVHPVRCSGLWSSVESSKPCGRAGNSQKGCVSEDMAMRVELLCFCFCRAFLCGESFAFVDGELAVQSIALVSDC